MIKLTIAGDVEKLVTIHPKIVQLNGPVGKQLNSSVQILPVEKYAFRIVEAKAKNGKYIKISLKEDKTTEGTGYILTIENLKKDKGRYSDVVLLKTTSKYQTTIKIPVYGNIIKTAQKKKG